MYKMKLLAGIVFQLFLAQSFAATQCLENTYKLCKAQSTNCVWCSLNVLAMKETSSILGTCMAKNDGCANVKFGTLNNFEMITFGQKIKMSMDLYNPAAGIPDPWYNTFKIPKSVTMDTCANCITATHLWCQINDDKEVAVAALCLPKSLSFVCHTDIIPPFIQKLTKFQLSPISEAKYCAAKNIVILPTPQAKCGDNFSCDTCKKSSSSCTWCGIQFSVTYIMTFPLYFTGICMDGAGANCDTAKFPSLLQEIPKIPDTKNIMEVRDAFKKDEVCTAVQWPASFTIDTCGKCVSDNKLGWCNTDGMVGIKDKQRMSGGMCFTKEQEFLCSISVSKYPMNTKWYNHASQPCSEIPKSELKDKPKPTEKPPKPCKDHLNCKDCNTGTCTWCGAQFTSSGLLTLANFGYCTPGKTCNDVLPSLLQSFDIGNAKVTGEVKAIDKNHDNCLKTNFSPIPSSKEDKCENCLKGKHEWCTIEFKSQGKSSKKDICLDVETCKGFKSTGELSMESSVVATCSGAMRSSLAGGVTTIFLLALSQFFIF